MDPHTVDAQIDHAIDVLSGSTAGSLPEATRVFGADTYPAIHVNNRLARISFDQKEPVTRRETALVLLRSRLVAWRPGLAEEAQFEKEFEEALIQAIISNKQDAFLTWRLAALASGLLCTAFKDEQRWRGLQQAIPSFLTLGPDSSDLQAALIIGKALYSDALPAAVLLQPHLLEQLVNLAEVGHKSPAWKMALEMASAVLECCCSTSQSKPGGSPSAGFASRMFQGLLEQALQNPDRTIQILEVAVSIGELRNSAIWSQKALEMVSSMMDHENHWLRNYGTLPREADVLTSWADGPAERRGEVAKQVASLSVSACSSDITDDLFRRKCLLYLVHLVSLPPATQDMTQEEFLEAMERWEILKDDELVYPDGRAEISFVALEHLTRFVDIPRHTCMAVDLASKLLAGQFSALAKVSEATGGIINPGNLIDLSDQENAEIEAVMFGRQKSISPALEEKFLKRMGLEYAGWCILVQLLSSECSDVKVEQRQIECGLSRWSRPLAVRVDGTLVTKFLSAKLRTMGFKFLSEAWESFAPAIARSAMSEGGSWVTVIRHVMQEETCFRVQHALLGTLCRIFNASIQADDESFREDFCSIALDSLLPLLQSPSKMTASLSSQCVKEVGEIMLLELIMGALSISLPLLPPEQLIRIYDILMHCTFMYIGHIPDDAKASALAECSLDLASRAVECAQICEMNSIGTPRKTLPINYVQDARLIFDCALKLIKLPKDALNTLRERHGSLAMTTGGELLGIHAATFQTSLLQVSSRLIEAIHAPPGVDSAAVAREAAGEDIKKLRDMLEEVIKFLDGHQPISQKEETPSYAPLARPTLTVSPEVSSLTIPVEGGSKQQTITINTAVLEDTVGALQFLAVSARPIFPSLTPEEGINLLGRLGHIAKESPFHLARKAALEALKEVLGLLAESIRGNARNVTAAVASSANAHTFFETLEAAYLANEMLSASLNEYLLRLETSFALALNAAKMARLDSEIDELLYIASEMCEGGKDAATLVFCKPLSLLPATYLPALNQQPPVAQHFVTLMELVARATAQNGDSGDDDQESVIACRADATMQVCTALMAIYGPWCVQPFENTIKPFFAANLSSESCTVVARTAALVSLAGCAKIKDVQSSDMKDLLMGALFFCKPRMLEEELTRVLRQILPSIESNRPAPDAQYDLSLLVPYLRQTNPLQKDDDTLVEEFLETNQQEVIKIQAALYCVGVVCRHGVSAATILEMLPSINETFMEVLCHPLASLPSRRLILDCLATAYLKVWVSMSPDCQVPDNCRLFTPQGLCLMLNRLLPVIEDAEDAAWTHDHLAMWMIASYKNTDLGRLPNMETHPDLRQEVLRIAEEVATDDTLSATYRARSIFSTTHAKP